jgi:hypothetical protein
MSRDYRRPTRTDTMSAASAESLGPLAMPLWAFLAVWLICAVIAAFSWDNLIANTQGANSFGVTARVVLAVSFGLPGAGVVSFVVGIFRRPASAA